MLIHDVIKTLYVRQGYLPDFPYHLISDEEMFDAFLHSDVNFFTDMYPCPEDMEIQYEELKSAIDYHIDLYQEGQTSSISASTYSLPDWIYSYMIGAVIGPQSTEQDRHNLFVLLDLDNIEDEFNSAIYTKIYHISQRWIQKLNSAERDHRPPTMFGEPHVIKSLRIANA